MAESVAQTVADIRSQGALSATEAEVLRVLNRMHVRMVTRTRAYRKVIDAGVTVADQAEYPLVGVVEIYALTIDGVTYGKTSRPTTAGSSEGVLYKSAGGGSIVARASEDGVEGLVLDPVPTEAGLAISGYAAMKPPTLTLDESADGVLRVDDDFVEGLIAGTQAAFLSRGSEARPDLAADLRQQFDADCEELRKRVQRRFRGPGPAQIYIDQSRYR